MELGIEIKQSQTLSPQMIQAMEILQMGTQELVEYIQEAQLENPILEEQEQESTPIEPQIAPQQGEWDSQNSWYDSQDWQDGQVRPSYDRADRPLGAESLAEHLYSQITADGQLATATKALIQGLNPCGYLEEALEAVAERTGLPLEVLEEGLTLLQSLEPAGVGAKNLSQCLRLQLKRMGEGGLAVQLVTAFLPQLAQSRFHQIAQQTGASREEIQQALTLIRGLNPKPGASYGDWQNTGYIVPDIYILEGEEGLFVQMRGGDIPQLTLSHYYQSLLADCQEEGVQNYLSTKMRQAKWLIQGITQRQETLSRCANFILMRQQDFFLGQGELKPLLLRDGADALHIHESTVSRALREKYLQCSRGVFPLSYFFSRNLGGEGEETTAHEIKSRLQKLIETENKQKPLSDQKLCDILNQEGLTISRRTVAKYREAMGLPSAPGRRVF